MECEQDLNIFSQDVSNHSLEYICQVYDFIQFSLKALKYGEKLIFSVLNSNNYLYKDDKYFTLNLPPFYVGLWDKQALINLQKLFKIKLDRNSTESN